MQSQMRGPETFSHCICFRLRESAGRQARRLSSRSAQRIQ